MRQTNFKRGSKRAWAPRPAPEAPPVCAWCLRATADSAGWSTALLPAADLARRWTSGICVECAEEEEILRLKGH